MIDIKKNLDENFNVLTESQLFEIQDVLDFSHLPGDFDHPEISRLIVSVPDHDLMKLISAKVKKRIPAFEERLELQRLETQESKIEKRKKDLKKQIVRAQVDFKKKVEPKKTESKKTVEKEVNDSEPKLSCPYCEKKIKSQAGLSSHIRSIHPEEIGTVSKGTLTIT